MADGAHGHDRGGVRPDEDKTGWWQAADGKWYRPELHPGGNWWKAGDGRWYPPGPGWTFSAGRWLSLAEADPAVIAAHKRRATIRVAGWVVLGFAGFILFTGAFSSQDTGTTEDTNAFFIGCLIVAVIVGLIGAAMIWPTHDDE